MWEPTVLVHGFVTDAWTKTVITLICVIWWKLPRSFRFKSADIFALINIDFLSHSSKIWPSVGFGLRKIACLRVSIAKHDRQRSQRWRASSRGPGYGARSICRLCKVIQRVMTEEQATADSGFSRYVGHSEGALVCIFLLPCLFLCCLSSHNRLSAYFFRDILLFSCFFGLLTDKGDCLDKVGNVKRHWELRGDRGVVYVGNPMTFVLQTFLFLLIKYTFVKL